MGQNSGPQKPKRMEKYLAEKYAIMIAPDGRRETIPIDKAKQLMPKGWRRVN